ncbi:MAG: hypothetical protein ACK47B_11620 [Armatimonadota bacterium]
MKQFFPAPSQRRPARTLVLLGIAGLGSALVAMPQAEAQRDATRPGDVRAYAYQLGIGAQGARIVVQWDRPSRVPSSYVLGHVIHRTSDLGITEVVGGIDSDSSRRFLDTEATRTFRAWDGAPNGEDAGSRTEFTDVPGIVPGQQYVYRVSTAYINGLQDRDLDGVPDDAQYMSPTSMPSPRVTALAPPTVAAINGLPSGSLPNVDLRAVEVEWAQTPGADTYVIWASADSRFKKKNTVKLKPVRSVPVDQGGPSSMTRTLNLRSGVAGRKLRKAKRIFITVGARNSADAIKPKPFGAIFSAPVQVRPEAGPPPPP